jgi:hypothetical protein
MGKNGDARPRTRRLKTDAGKAGTAAKKALQAARQGAQAKAAFVAGLCSRQTAGAAYSAAPAATEMQKDALRATPPTLRTSFPAYA